MINNVTTIDELIQASKGEIVELPAFSQGSKFYARMRRPSMMKLIEQGKIPNSLLTAANSMFAGTVDNEMALDQNFLKEMLSVIDVLAEASFVEPSYRELKEAGVELTDEQYMFIFNYTQSGVRAVTPSVPIPENPSGHQYGSNVQV